MKMLGSLFTASLKLVEPDRDEGAVRVETTKVRRNSGTRPPEGCAGHRPACEQASRVGRVGLLLFLAFLREGLLALSVFCWL